MFSAAAPDETTVVAGFALDRKANGEWNALRPAASDGLARVFNAFEVTWRSIDMMMRVQVQVSAWGGKAEESHGRRCFIASSLPLPFLSEASFHWGINGDPAVVPLRLDPLLTPLLSFACELIMLFNDGTSRGRRPRRVVDAKNTYKILAQAAVSSQLSHCFYFSSTSTSCILSTSTTPQININTNSQT